MGDPTGFLRTPRETARGRPVHLRLQDWRDVHEPVSADQVRLQAGRCMDCWVPFCHAGCPLGNLIPGWNDLVWRGAWEGAAERSRVDGCAGRADAHYTRVHRVRHRVPVEPWEDRGGKGQCGRHRTPTPMRAPARIAAANPVA
jgi:Dihydroprymidine dehydrogenase domain II, 4Fe-4S cluster